jgi:sugar phosphate isomerase/epimerase
VAEKIGARIIVLHIGAVTDETLRSLFLEYRRKFMREKKKNELATLKDRIIRSRAAHRRHLDIAARMLERLCRSFPNTDFCFETRLHYQEIPTLDQASYLFDSVQLPNLFYRHDTSHSYVQDRLGFARQTEWQRRFGGRCRGIHVHDAETGLKDYLPPGSVSMYIERILCEFETTLPYTIENHPQFPPGEVVSGIKYLKEKRSFTRCVAEGYLHQSASG